MDDPFQIRVHSAAVAAWWAFLIACAFVVFQWIVYLTIMAKQPAWVVSVWGPGATWESIRTFWFQGLAILKLTLWPLVLAAVWLTFWGKQLRKRQRVA